MVGYGKAKESWLPSALTLAAVFVVSAGLLYWLHGTSVGAAGTITVGLPSGSATTCSPRFSSEDVWPGYFYDIPPPTGGPTLTQRINSLGLDYWRVQAVAGYNDASTSLPSPSAYTTAQGHAISAWSFGTLDKVLSDGPSSAPRLLDLTAPPEVLWTGTGDGSQGALADQTYAALAQYYANVMKYFRTGILATNSGSAVTYTTTTLTDSSANFAAYGGGTYAVTATLTDANGFPDWETATITAVSPDGHTLTLAWPSGTPAAGAAYNLASTTPPVTSPTNATPWPRPPSVGNVQYAELFNESDLSNSSFPRTSPALPAPTPTLTGVNVAGGTLTPGTTYAYRLTAVNIGTAESLPGTQMTLTLPAGDNAVQISWSATSNLGLSPFAYRIYGRSSGAEQAMVVVGSQASSGLTWTDKGGVTPSGALPTTDGTPGFQVWRSREYTRMWNAVAPAIKAVDATIQVVGPVISNPQSVTGASTVTTAITTGPSDSSWQDSTDYIPYLMAHGVPKPDVVSFHSYGNYLGSSSTDASYFSGLQYALNTYLSLDDVSMGTTPAWITETNIDAGFLDSTDYRAATQLGSAWMADEMAAYCQQAPKVQQLFQFEVANTNTWSLFSNINAPANCYPQPSCLGIKASEPTLEYWLIYWASRYFPTGSKIAPVTNVPAGYVALAVQPPGSSKVSVLVVNVQTGASPGVGTAGTATVQLSGATSTDTQEVVIDGSADETNGPGVTDLGAVSTVNLSLAGYGVAILSFNTAATSDTTAPSVPANLRTTATASSSIALAWDASTDNVGGSGVAGYRLYRGGTLLTTIPAGSGLSYTDTALSANTSYSYTISAYDYAGNASAQSGALSASTTSTAVSGDCNSDGHVTIIDLSILLSHYGAAYPACDFHNDGYVSIIDLSILLSNYGR